MMFSGPPARRLLALTALGLALGSCARAKTPTELVFVTDAEGELEKVKFHIEGGSALGLPDPESKMGPKSPPPFFFGLVREHAPLDHITVTAEGWSNGQLVVQHTARVSFSRNEVLVVPLHLAKRCWKGADDVFPCTGEGHEGETCTERGCEPIDMPDDQLSQWNGKPPRMHHQDEDPITGDDGGSDETPGGDGEDDQDPGHKPPPPAKDAGMIDDRDPDAGHVMPGMDAGHDAGHLDNGRDAGLDNGREDAGHANGR